LLHSLRERVGLVVLDFPSPPPSDLRVTFDGRLVDGLFTETEHPAALGEVAIEASASGRATIRRPVLVGPEPIHVTLAFAETPPEAVVRDDVVPTAEPRAGRTVHGLSGPIVAGVGLAVGIGAIVTRVIANGEYDALEQRCRGHICPDGPEASARIDRLDTAALVSGIGSAALLGLGATLYFVVDKRTERAPAASQAPKFSIAFDPRSRAAAWSLTF
jgi:hypothetical protein